MSRAEIRAEQPIEIKPECKEGKRIRHTAWRTDGTAKVTYTDQSQEHVTKSAALKRLKEQNGNR